jgi:DNA-binding response OmpR family regulator
MEEMRILIVEDEIKIADTLKQGLEENGYIADIAYDGLTGERLAEPGKYQVILLDVNLPGINGFDLCRRIRESDTTVVIIMLTALNTISDKMEGYGKGADDYMVKPFEFRELLLKIGVLMKRTSSLPAAGQVLKAGDLEINLDSKLVSRNKQYIHLTAKEFQLLEYLMKNKNKVVSRAEIAMDVWDIDFDTNTNVIDVYINYLRTKIDKPFDTKLIHTQVGMGYVLKDQV